MNATIGSVVHFYCFPYFPEHNISWYINGSELVRSTSSAVSLLSETIVEITAHPEFNTTAVYCRLNGTSITSPTAVLLIQGRERFYCELGPVSDLCATEYGPDYLLVSWIAPFSLDITESDSDMWFSLSALTPNGSLLPCPACQNITNTFYNLSLSSFHHKGVYEIEVVAGNVYSSGNRPVKMPVYVMEQVSTHKDLSNISTNSTALGMLYIL